MKTLKKLLSIVLILTFTLTSTALLVSADPMPLDLPSDISTQDMNELTARSIVNTYFAERLAFLTGYSESIASAVEPITNDEITHRETLVNNNITYISYTLSFVDIIYWDNVAEVTVEETVTYLENSVQKNCVITHTILLYIENSGNAIIGSDGYVDPIIDFESASYVSQSATALDPLALTGSNLCIINIAIPEVGTGEEPGIDNANKYTRWYTEKMNNIYNNSSTYFYEWCAIFVSWCAEQAHISTSAIPFTADPKHIRNTLNNQNRYYLSSAHGGSYTPVPGDLIFMRGTPAQPGHIGIVVSVNGNNVRIIDGNWSEMVCDRTISLSTTCIVGYGNPNYVSNNHAGTVWHSNANQHYMVCNNCSCSFAHASHIYRQVDPLSPYVCRICGHAQSFIEIEP